MIDMTFNDPPQDTISSLAGKTILQVIPNLELGGAERTAVDIAGGVVEAGGRALVASAGGRLVSDLEALGGEHITLPLDAKLRLDRFWSNRTKLSVLCRERDVDLVHARSRAPAFPALQAARALDLPFLTTYHGIYSEENALKRWYNSVMVAGDAVIANSHYTADIVRKRYATASERIHVIHRGTDMARFSPERVTQNQINALRTAWDLPRDRLVVLLLARLTEWKGHLHAIEALAKLKTAMEEPPLFLFVGGAQSEGYHKRLNEAIAAHDLMDDVIIKGATDDVPTALSLADVVIAPSMKPEAFGRSVAEASAMERPVIAFDHGGAIETIAVSPEVPDDQRTGFRVPVGDSTALAKTIEAALRLSDGERREMGRRGRRHVAAHFSKHQMVSKTIALYRMLTNGKTD
ncbi:MAG: glycosyltransferase family 4 protein [Pseudomonadota bacterium]